MPVRINRSANQFHFFESIVPLPRKNFSPTQPPRPLSLAKNSLAENLHSPMFGPPKKGFLFRSFKKEMLIWHSSQVSTENRSL